uniref:Kinesin motor domain-containing protein n=1 Tax=Steinernema glaseri TaxID=37863 RepID=A0A1I8A7M4_9BILA
MSSSVSSIGLNRPISELKYGQCNMFYGLPDKTGRLPLADVFRGQTKTLARSHFKSAHLAHKEAESSFASSICALLISSRLDSIIAFTACASAASELPELA